MAAITVNHTTVLKQSIDSHENGLWLIRGFTLGDVAKAYVDKDQHCELILNQPRTLPNGTKATKFKAFILHFDNLLEIASQPLIQAATRLSVSGSKEIKIPVKWRAQNDNRADIGSQGPGSRHCNACSNTVAIASLWGDDVLESWGKTGGFNQPEERFLSIVDKYGDTTDHGAIGRALSELGIESYWTTTLSFADLCRILDRGVAVPIGEKYKSSGHITAVTGRNLVTGGFKRHDSYGIRSGASDQWIEIFPGGSGLSGGGAYDEARPDTMQALWLDQGSNESGWGRVITAFNHPKTGQRIETGIPRGL
jgi:hypothetical protein